VSALTSGPKRIFPPPPHIILRNSRRGLTDLPVIGNAKFGVLETGELEMPAAVTESTSEVLIEEYGTPATDDPPLAAQTEEADVLLAQREAEEQARLAAQAEFGFGLTGSEPGQGSLSNEELMAWVAQHNDKLNGELRELMGTADERIKLAEDLTKVKGLVGAHLDPGAAKAAAEALIEQYKGTPYEGEVQALLEPLVKDMSDNINDAVLDDEIVTKHHGDIQAMIDGIQKQDQLDMIAIQDLTSRIRENTQLVSNIVSSINQTTMSIVGNVGRA
jgi:hypothetical protein